MDGGKVGNVEGGGGVERTCVSGALDPIRRSYGCLEVEGRRGGAR